VAQYGYPVYNDGRETKLYVIHADNSSFFRKVIKVFLEELGIDSNGFERGDDVLNEVGNRKVSCVITGLELADMTGEELIRQLQYSGHLMTIIAVTSSKNETRIKTLEEMGVKTTIQKGGNWKDKLREYF
jgi:FixJ family two-component response regulator